MKRLLAALCALLLIVIGLSAQGETNTDEARQSAIGMLTEVYGYTQEEAEAFTFEVADADPNWHVDFSPKDHPQWVYSAEFNKGDNSFIAGTTPFYVSHYPSYPGESTVRSILRSARDDKWFDLWSQSSLTALQQLMTQEGVNCAGVLADGGTAALSDVSQSITDFFVSCYGDTSDWSVALLQWRNEEISSYGLTAAAVSSTPTGMHTYIMKNNSTAVTYTVTEFTDQVPPELLQTFTHPKLIGWTCLGGALRTAQSEKKLTPGSLGLVAFARGEDRLLVMLYRKSVDLTWSVFPVGEKALLRNRAVYITCDALKGMFTMHYPISAQESETFRVQLVNRDSEGTLFCQLKDYRHTNDATEEITAIDSDSTQRDGMECWYHVTSSPVGQPAREAVYPAVVPSALEYIDVNNFPTTSDACASAAGYSLPEGYALVSGVHLRAKTSSHANDLGLYAQGTLAQVLENLPGDPFPWYRVHVGRVEGYMSSVYVLYDDAAQTMQLLSKSQPLTVAKPLKNIALKKGTGLFDETVMELSAGTKMHVMAELGDWLHVMVPQDEIGWLMDVNGTDGYVRASDVVQAPTAVQLDWLE